MRDLEPLGNLTNGRSDAATMLLRYDEVRRVSEQICQALEPEDCVIQSMPDASPVRWHLAHTTWFFETFVLAADDATYSPHAPEYEFLFNSYYNSVGEQFPRPERGMLSRPTVAEIIAYRREIDVQLRERLQRGLPDSLLAVIEIGLHHEQQHQELMLTDVKHLFSKNPLLPAFHTPPTSASTPAPVADLRWQRFEEGIRWIGHEGAGFAFDNEQPRHRVFADSFELTDRLVTVGEYLEFIESGGYRDPQFWLSLGWHTACEQAWQTPLYWQKRNGGWHQFTLAGLTPLVESEPVTHISYFEADAYARWAGARLPSEAEWETAAAEIESTGNFYQSGHLHPQPVAATAAASISQLLGDVWEWTMSPYTPYPGFRPLAAALGEYNGKFMCNQYVLRGGSCITSESHIRPTYRNFFPPEARWQFSGFRLARDGADG